MKSKLEQLKERASKKLELLCKEKSKEKIDWHSINHQARDLNSVTTAILELIKK